MTSVRSAAGFKTWLPSRVRWLGGRPRCSHFQSPAIPFSSCERVPAVGEDGADVTCCVPGDRGPECEDRTQAECDAQGGTVVTAGSCLPDPCGATNPPRERGQPRLLRATREPPSRGPFCTSSR